MPQDPILIMKAPILQAQGGVIYYSFLNCFAFCFLASTASSQQSTRPAAAGLKVDSSGVWGLGFGGLGFLV